MLIENKVKNLKTTDVDTFLSWEFNTLKAENRDVTKLKNAIIKSGWSFPVITWAGHNFVIDGAGRKLAVIELLKDGYDIPEIPYVEVEAKDINEAKQKALEVSSQFGEITRDSFFAFTADLKVEFDSIEIKGIDESLKLSQDEFGEDFKLPEGDKSLLEQITFTLSNGQAEQIKNAIEEVKGTEAFKYVENFGNSNSNGNALYLIITQWDELKRLS